MGCMPVCMSFALYVSLFTAQARSCQGVISHKLKRTSRSTPRVVEDTLACQASCSRPGQGLLPRVVGLVLLLGPAEGAVAAAEGHHRLVWRRQVVCEATSGGLVQARERRKGSR
jgi:hypothetical protein